MNSCFSFSRAVALPVCAALSLAAAGLPAAAQTPSQADVASKQHVWTGTATAEVTAHAYDGGFKDGVPEFVSRYLPMRSLSGDDYPGYYVDVSHVSLSLIDSVTRRPVFGFERQAFGYFNQRNALYFDRAPARLEFNYSLYRSQQMKPDHRADPAVAPSGALPNSIFAKFNDDSLGRRDYHVLREDYGVSLTLRPEAFGYTGNQIGNIDLSYDLSDRSSVRFFDYVLTRRLAGGTTYQRTRWRGINQRVNENVNRFSLGLSASPFNWFGVSYEMAVEKYERDFTNATLDVAARLGNVPVLPYTAAAASSGPESFMDKHTTEFWPVNQVGLGWTPSTVKFTNKIKFDKAIGRGLLNFGYGTVLLKQESFSAFAQDRGFDRGEIFTTSAFANWSMRLTPTIAWTAHAGHRVRENDSRFPALDPQRRLVNPTYGTSVYDYMNPLLDGGKHGGVFAPFIREIETLKVGTDLTFALPVASSRIVAGWTREDTSRDLIFGNPPVGQVRTIDPNEALVRPESVSDTLFLNYSGKLKSGVKLRWHNSVVLADDVGLITEARKGYKSRANASYYWPKIWQGAGVDVFYQVRYGYNNAFQLTSVSNDFTKLLSTARQNREQTLQSAGITFNALPSKEATVYAGYLWNRDQLEANLLFTSARRYENNWVFVSTNRDQYLSDAHTLFAGGSYQFSSRVSGTFDYSVTAIDGALGSGTIKAVMGAGNAIENIAHNVGGSLTVALQNNISVTGRYTYARYDDAVNNAFDGGFHTFSVLVTKRF